MLIKQYEIFLVCLDPTVGHEIKKTRPCVIVSPDEMNENIATVIIAPITSQSHPYPTRLSFKFHGKEGWIVLDQIRTVDRQRLIKKIGKLDSDVLRRVKATLKEMLVD